MRADVNHHLERLLQLPAEERLAALEALRREGLDDEVTDYLSACLDDDFLAGQAWDVAPELLQEIVERTDAERWIGRRFGAWRVVEHLGAGGMGRVFAVERADGEYELTAALKLLAAVWGEGAAERFRVERQILARLEHPHIARLLDGGATESGTPWFVMEYVEGRPITTYCDDRGLSLVERLRLFEQVCRAVECAHNQLIVHRDLKPSNILVTNDGEPRLLDFGLAKALEDPGTDDPATRPTQRWMTFEYASPEQIKGEAISTRSDTYQLGLILYELLTGQRAYSVEGLSPTESERLICEREPRRPSTAVVAGHTAAGVGDRSPKQQRLRKRLKGDLDTIVLKALSKDPERGYTSAGNLADDIDLHLKGLPIRARPDSVGYRATKFIRRHRASVVATGATIVALAAMLVYHTISLTAERDQAQLQRDRAQEATAFMVELFETLEPGTTAADAETASRLVAMGLDKVDTLADQPLLQAKTLTVLGRVSYSLGMFDQAERHLRAAVEVHQRELGANHLDAATSKQHLAFMLWTRGRAWEAETYLREALAVRRSLFGEADSSVASSMNLLGLILRDQGRSEESAAVHRETLAVRRRLSGPSSATIAISLDNLGTAIEAQGDLGAAESFYRRALAMNREVWGIRHVLVATNMTHLGRLLTKKGNLQEAGALLRDALAMKRELWGASHYSVAGTLCYLGDYLRRLNDFAEAASMLDECLDIYRHAGNEQRVAMAHSYRGDLRLDERGFAAAESDYLRARELYAEQFEDNHPRLEQTDQRLLHLYQEWGRPERSDAVRSRRVALGSG